MERCRLRKGGIVRRAVVEVTKWRGERFLGEEWVKLVFVKSSPSDLKPSDLKVVKGFESRQAI